MVVLTPQGRAAIVGTHFTLAADATQSRLEVIEGKVRLTGAQKTESILVDHGEFAVLAQDMKLEAIPSERDPALWPFSTQSPWNHPIGSGAKYAEIDSPKFNPAKGAELVVDDDAIPIFVATAADPERMIFRTTTASGKNAPHPTEAKPNRARINS